LRKHLPRWNTSVSSATQKELDKVDYRGGGKHVVVLPRTTINLIEFDFETPDRIRWTGQNCVLVRVGTASTHASGAPPSTADAGAGSRCHVA
jgi:hypothetical protein